MRVPRALLFVLLLAGCGGSGSSGFDSSFAEGALIDRAIAEQRCVQGDGDLTICPSGAAVANPIGGLPGPSELRIVATLGGDGMVACSGPGGASPCSLQVDVATDGLPPGAEVRLAVRVVPGPWSVGPALAVQPQAGGMGVVAPVTVDVAGAQGPDAAEAAVLVFRAPLAAPPAPVDELRTTGASYAFVLPAVPVSGDAGGPLTSGAGRLGR
jgi:hypothetical protein